MNTLCMMMWGSHESLVTKTLQSALPFVDRWIVSDLGSDQNSFKALVDATRGKPGKLIHASSHWETARKELFDLAWSELADEADSFFWIELGEEVACEPGARLPFCENLRISGGALEARIFRQTVLVNAFEPKFFLRASPLYPFEESRTPR